MAKSNYTTTIAIDTNRSAVHFYSMVGNDKRTITHNIKSYAGEALDESFFERFKEIISEYVANTPSESVRKVTVVLPDSAVLTDAIKVPTVKGSAQMQKMLDVTLGGLYCNYNDLHIIARMADQNKQYSTVGITAVQNSIVSSIYSVCAENKLLVDTLTYASAASVAGATLFNSKLKNASYLLLDIKDVYSKFVFVVDGKVMGFYTLPFGLEFLRSQRVVREDTLFEHSYAELVVLNAQEKARSKKLTVMAFGDSSYRSNIDASSEDYDPTDMEENSTDDQRAFDNESTAGETTVDNGARKIFVKKSSKSLPRFMLQDVPETEEGIVYANFRVFVKWALNLIQNNEKITELDQPQTVCVNLPDDLSYVIDLTNRESDENGIMFTHLPASGEAPIVSANLELYGGLFPSQINSANKL